jgi:hypothetical protein
MKNQTENSEKGDGQAIDYQTETVRRREAAKQLDEKRTQNWKGETSKQLGEELNRNRQGEAAEQSDDEPNRVGKRNS